MHHAYSQLGGIDPGARAPGCGTAAMGSAAIADLGGGDISVRRSGVADDHGIAGAHQRPIGG
jgi:hypothetical protein